MNEAVEGVVGLTKSELCEAVTMWLRRMGRPLEATDVLGGYDFAVRRMTTEEEHYEHETEAEVLRLLRLRKTIEAITYHRGRSGYGLRESKDHIDRLKREHGL